MIEIGPYPPPLAWAVVTGVVIAGVVFALVWLLAWRGLR